MEKITCQLDLFDSEHNRLLSWTKKNNMPANFIVRPSPSLQCFPNAASGKKVEIQPLIHNTDTADSLLEDGLLINYLEFVFQYVTRE